MRIDFDDILNDAFACCKDPGFDPKKPLKIQIRVKPAVDTGGVVQKSYTTLLGVVAKRFFERIVSKLPTYSVGILSS